MPSVQDSVDYSISI